MNAKGINLSRKKILNQLRTLLESWLDDTDSITEIVEETNLLTDLRIDSVGILQFVLGVEKEFKISIKDYELDSEVFSRMSSFIDIIEGKLHENNRLVEKQCSEKPTEYRCKK